MDNPYDVAKKRTNRISKLKRRKRKTSPTNFPNNDNANPLAKFAASASANPGGNARSSTHRLDLSTEEVEDVGSIHGQKLQSKLVEPSSSDHQQSGLRTDLFRPPMKSSSAREILNLEEETFSEKAISAEIDYFITSRKERMRNNSTIATVTNAKKHRTFKNMERREIEHRILGSAILNLEKRPSQKDETDNSEEKRIQMADDRRSLNELCKLAFPPIQAKVPVGHVKAGETASNCVGSRYQRGDGMTIINSDLNFPKELSTTKSKWVKIISKSGATVRSRYDIDEHNESIGKLPFGSVRLCLDSKQLAPPPDSDSDSEGDPMRFVAVMRFKLQLLPCDVTSMFDSYHEGVWAEGWVSDRSRLFDLPYVIADLIE